MFNSKTVIVVGAGASHEAGLPTGHELKKRIAELLDIRFGYNPLRIGAPEPTGDDLIKDALREYCRQLNPTSPVDINPYVNAAWRIRDATPLFISIDNFIDQHSGNKEIELCGKLAIARSILEAEMNSMMYYNKMKGLEKIDFKSLENTWYASFMKLLTENCRIGDIQKSLSSLTLIVFNYDRCIEHFLFHSLQNCYGLSDNDAAEHLNNIRIYHPYGIVGYLPWQKAGNLIDFGGKPHPSGLLTLAEQIKTFSEGTDPKSSELLAIRQKICEADIIIFIGFAFHNTNIDLLKPNITSSHEFQRKAFYATAWGISVNNGDIIKSQLDRLTGKEAKIIHFRSDLHCNQLFDEYWKSLSLS
jgi:hypothetical protein